MYNLSEASMDVTIMAGDTVDNRAIVWREGLDYAAVLDAGDSLS